MKKSLALILAGSLAFGSLKLFSQDFELPHETDPYKFVPQEAVTLNVAVKTDYGILIGIWYEKELQSVEDYTNKLAEEGGIIPKEEFFFDLDGDDILDLSLEKLDELYNEYVQQAKLEKSSL